MGKTKRISLIAVYLALAIALGFIERLITLPTTIPGVKLGLSNIITIISIFTLPLLQVIFLVVLRVLITSFLFTGFSAIWFSLAGALTSMLIMLILIFIASKVFSLASISVIGAISHNIGQLMVASFVVNTTGIFYYLPVLLVSAIVTGYLVGITSKRVLVFLLKRGYIRHISELKALM